MEINTTLQVQDLQDGLNQFFDLSGEKIKALNESWDPAEGSPVFTVEGKYTTRGWTEWTQGFQYGCQILQFDATDEAAFLSMGRQNTVDNMAPHVSHVGVHDHGFNNVSTYGNLRRLALEGRMDASQEVLDHYALALKVSGAVQAARWTTIADGTGYIHSFNGPQSLFSDTIRSCRSLMVAHRLGHVLMGEGDKAFSLLERAGEHIKNTSRYNVYYGDGRDRYDLRGRVVHESIFNTADGQYRCPSTQQGYSPFSTWTRGLAWILLGAAEELEFLSTLGDEACEVLGGRESFEDMLTQMAKATSKFYINHSCTDGIPYWDTGAPGLVNLPPYGEGPSMPDNPFEPVDSSAAAIAAQGLLRLGHHWGLDNETGQHYWQAGLTVAESLFKAPYLSKDPAHQGLLLHSVYHHPNGWDHIPPGKAVPLGESSMWGDYHAMELAVYLKRIIEEQAYLTFYGAVADQEV